MSLQALPPETFELITEYLAYEDPPSLLSLACVNKSSYKWCRSAINLVFFHDIKISIDSEKDISQVVGTLRKKLEEADSFRQVRRLIIATKQDGVISSDDWEPPKFSELRSDESAHTYTTQYSDMLDRRLYGIHISSVDTVSDQGWNPVADLIQDLPALSDLIYRLSDVFPLDLLEVLRPGWVSGMLPQYSALMRSPNLYRIMIHYDIEDDHDAGIARLQAGGLFGVLGLASNLKTNREVKSSPWKAFGPV
ncbi:uncharacterized protein N7496_004281 [Penicillium cataractarum]|uniref:F-box domain-containing protein n=1 Tax=Penicillium cataractarum TaxID=2100454 RepID=A0A9W9SSV8_9EURO|nr:uncharacterized protein N7496_004281 [Penicillium cataractarum]KAJ5381853.1 hypothetical protein N7496_004281 [Penicillium cataractarum]